MYDSNYYVAMDENGQPYIAHALFRSSVSSDGGGRGRHKYMAKFDNFFKNGKAFYAYTQQQVQQALNRGRNRAKNTANYLTGGREALQTRNALRSAYKTAKANEKNTGGSHPANKQLTASLKSEYEKADKAYNNTLLGKVRDKLGYDERERRDDALERRNQGTSSKNLQKARNYDFKTAQDEYSKTLLGRAEYLKSAMKVVSSNIKRHANDTLASIREKFGPMDDKAKYAKAKATVETRDAAYQVKKHANETLGDIRSAAGKAGEAVKNAPVAVKARANEIIKNATKGGDIKEQRDALLSAYNQAKAGKHPDDRALAAALQKELNRVNKEYEKTWKAKGEFAKKQIETRAKVLTSSRK